MSWVWKQAAGELWRDGKLVAAGYSGAPGHKNKTESEGLKGAGPIPRGRWQMFYVYVAGHRLGQYAIALRPVGHKALGRNDFMVHADSIRNPGAASQGCVILPLEIRRKLAGCVGKPGGVDLIDVV